ncbi:MAG: hypothetical protein J7M12_02285, partial [Candidatus Hydrogenedentes bacterium]|nr:hypothetical protein [Candidatus Hydrogenedentota bacterium]
MNKIAMLAFAILTVSGTSNLCRAETKVTLLADEQNPRIAFAVQELKKALVSRDCTVDHAPLTRTISNGSGPYILLGTQKDKAMIDTMRNRDVVPFATLKPEGFSLRKVQGNSSEIYWVVGADDAGVMYGGLELAEIVRCSGLAAVQSIDRNPYMQLRGIKFNCPLDERTPTYSNHDGDSQQKNVLVMWDMDFWKAYIDDMARFRYNYLSLWNLHPFPSMVRVPGYEKIALDDVQSVTETLKMTMDEKIAFWRNVMRYARDRNVAVYVVTWNIFITGEDGIY